MKLRVDIQNASSDPVPSAPELRRWISAALAAAVPARDTECEISLRLVDEAEMTALNSNYRGKSGPTNVLSFPSDLPAELNLPLLGDLAICAPVVRREAREQGKPDAAHWAHMAVHGTLHLLGYDHEEQDEANAMEALETRILLELGFAPPYSDHGPEAGQAR
jgi:probable rRNA maturation factor